MFYALDQFIGESFTGYVQDLHFWMVLEDLVPDGIHQMGLAQAGITEKKKGIVGKGRIIGHGHGGRLGETVGIAYDEILKSVSGRKVGDKRTG